jgi:hypothetical protein
MEASALSNAAPRRVVSAARFGSAPRASAAWKLDALSHGTQASARVSRRSLVGPVEPKASSLATAPQEEA